MSILKFERRLDPSSFSGPRFTMRRGRVLPGPLKSLSNRRQTSVRSSFGIVVGAIVATSAVLATIADRDAVSSTSNPAASSEPAASAASSVVTDLTPRKVATREAVPTVAVPEAPAPLAPETVTTGSRHDETRPPIERVAAQSGSQTSPDASSSPFRLDQLPVLAEDASAFEADYGISDAAAATQSRMAGRAPSRRAPTQPRDPADEAFRLPQP